MKKLILILCSALLVTGCADSLDFKNQYKQKVIQLMKLDNDLSDYGMNPAQIATCVVDKTGEAMPGLFSWSSERATTYAAYTKLVDQKLAMSRLGELDNDADVRRLDPKIQFNIMKKAFKTVKAIVHAHQNFNGSILECMAYYTAKDGPS